MTAPRGHGRGDIRLDDVPVPTPTAEELLVKILVNPMRERR